MTILHTAAAVALAASSAFALTGAAMGTAHAQAPAALAAAKLEAARVRADIDHAMVLGAARAGRRIVAVGEAGAILLSDDDGKSFRQAQQVPADSTLTSVTFVDDRHGWAVGHWGVILHTDDGGEHWRLQRTDTATDQPIFSVAFRDLNHGWAVGLWSLLLETSDGGQTWQARKVGREQGLASATINFYSVFLGRDRQVFATGEQGTVLRSADDGQSWKALETGYKGSLWTGTETSDGELYVGGLRGNIYRSTNQGGSWHAVASGGTSSVTALLATSGGVAGVGLDGLVIDKRTAAAAFTATRVAGAPALTALVMNARGRPVWFSMQGVLQAKD